MAKGSKALEAAKKAYYELYTVENLQALIDKAKVAMANYPYTTYDQTQVEKVNKVIETAIANLSKSKTITWITIPTTNDNPFDFSMDAFNKWKMENGSDIGYGYFTVRLPAESG